MNFQSFIAKVFSVSQISKFLTLKKGKIEPIFMHICFNGFLGAYVIVILDQVSWIFWIDILIVVVA